MSKPMIANGVPAVAMADHQGIHDPMIVRGGSWEMAENFLTYDRSHEYDV